jgi:hypothetical protein
MAAPKLETRVAALEQEVARLRERVEGNNQPWWKAIWGSFANDPAFLEAMRLGREYRESLRPKPAKKGKKGGKKHAGA